MFDIYVSGQSMAYMLSCRSWRWCRKLPAISRGRWTASHELPPSLTTSRRPSTVRLGDTHLFLSERRWSAGDRLYFLEELTDFASSTLLHQVATASIEYMSNQWRQNWSQAMVVLSARSLPRSWINLARISPFVSGSWLWFYARAPSNCACVNIFSSRNKKNQCYGYVYSIYSCSAFNKNNGLIN